MTKRTREDGSYTLTASEGYDLVVVVGGEEQARAKTVEIPAVGTLNEWVEAPEKPKEPEPAEETKEARIARLRAEIETLESGN